MTSSTAETVDHPFFARIWPAIAAHETEQMRELRRENLAGLSGRVLEVGAGSGTNFAFYPDTVAQVVAVEPEQRLVGLAREAAAAAPVPVEVTNRTVESFSADEPFDAVVCSLVLCSVAEPDSVLRQTVFVAAAGRRAALSGACGQRRGPGPAPAIRRRDDVAAAGGKLPHPPPHRAGDPGRGIRGRHGPNRTGIAGLGAVAGVGVRRWAGRAARSRALIQ